MTLVAGGCSAAEETNVASAPPLRVQYNGSGSREQEPSGAIAGGDPQVEGEEREQVALYQDLLQRANGDQHTVAIWLAEMGYNPAQFAAHAGAAAGAQPPQQSPSKIKAVGTREHGLGSWVTAAAHPSSSGKTKLCTDDSELDLKDDLDAEAAEAGAPKHFFCPISMHIMRDPVMLPTGQSYERECIERWLKQGHNSCPATGQNLKPPVALTPNVSLRNAIEEWCEKYEPRLLDPVTHRLRPIPKDASFALPTPPRAPSPQQDADLALALTLQQEEMARIAQQRQVAATTALQQRSSRAGRGTPSRQGSRASAGGGAAPAGDRHRSGPSWATPTAALLLAICAGFITVFLLSLSKNGWAIEELRLNPLVGPSQAALMRMGALSRDALVGAHQWWRLVTAWFVSAGIIQLVGNLTSTWAFGRYLERALPMPFLSICGIFVVSSGLGALASGNLNVSYVSCGASAGVCGLLGGVWADQLLNLKRCWTQVTTILVLVLITATFIMVSLLPLLDPWWAVSALLSGFCCAAILLLAPKVGRNQAGSGWRVAAQTLCAVLLIAGAAVGVLGLALPSDVGQQCGSFCRDVSCVRLEWWDCVAVGSGDSSGNCGLTVLANGTQALECPSGDYRAIPNISISATSDVAALCEEYCSAGSSAPGSSSPGGGSTSPGKVPGVIASKLN